jgi:hypothetical protein
MRAPIPRSNTAHAAITARRSRAERGAGVTVPAPVGEVAPEDTAGSAAGEPAANRFDHVLGVSERAANLHQALHERIVCDGDVFPDDVHQLLFGDQAARVARQVQQHVVGAGTQPEGLGSSEKQLAPGVERASEKNAPGRCNFGVVSASVRLHFVTRLPLHDYNGLQRSDAQ